MASARYQQRIVGCNGWTPDEQRALFEVVARGELDPVIDSVVPLEQLPKAMQALMERRVFGKVVVTP